MGYNILHYTVGMHKNRGGGMTKYIDDLIEAQKKQNNVFVLYPGKIQIINKNIRIKEEKHNDIKIFSIINPLPLPMLFGIQDYDYLFKKSKIDIWKSFLKDNRIEIIHMHTLMGIYEEFLDAANELMIPILYTTHDYFGICPKQTLFFQDNICNDWNNCKNCVKCNMTAMSKFKNYLVHTKLFIYSRKYKLFKIFKSKAKCKINKQSNNIRTKKKYDINYYLSLKEKMLRMFNKITFFHFNSSISSAVFHKAIPNINGKIINISHNGIVDNRIIRNSYSKVLRVTYLGPSTVFKGFYDIINAIDSIYKFDKNIELNIFSYTDIDRPYLIKHNNGYNYSDLSNIFNKTDIVISTSKCLETYGFTAAEALSYGVPVIVSDTMGVKDIVINEKNGYIINNSEIAFKLKFLMENKDILLKMNKYICTSKFNDFTKHCEEIDLLYKKIIEGKI